MLLNIEEKCLGTSESSKPSKLADGNSGLPLHKMTEEELADITFYISDTARTLQSFVADVFDEAAQAFYEVGSALFNKIQISMKVKLTAVLANT